MPYRAFAYQGQYTDRFDKYADEGRKFLSSDDKARAEVAAALGVSVDEIVAVHVDVQPPSTLTIPPAPVAADPDSDSLEAYVAKFDLDPQTVTAAESVRFAVRLYKRLKRRGLV